MSETLTLPLNGVYFDQIKAGTKPEEYRLVTPFWSKRLFARRYQQIVLTRGYPRADDHDRRLVLPWRGYTIKTITHPHFGPDPVEVFAIDVSAGVKLPPQPDEAREGSQSPDDGRAPGLTPDFFAENANNSNSNTEERRP